MLRSLKDGRNFENMEKNKWILRRSDLSKESFHKPYMTPQGQFLHESGTSVEKEILLPEKNRQICCN